MLDSELAYRRCAEAVRSPDELRRSWVVKVVFVTVIYALTAMVLFGCTSVRENPPQLTTDTTGSELANRNCILFCSVTGTFTGSPGRATNSGNARSTDSSTFVPKVEQSGTLTPLKPTRKKLPPPRKATP